MSSEPGHRDPRPFDHSAPWPPAPSDDDVFEHVIVNGVGDDGRPRGFRIRGRVVRLWGQRVVIDEGGDVHFPCCRRMVPVADLAAADNAHGVGLAKIRGALLPISGPDPRPRKGWW